MPVIIKSSHIGRCCYGKTILYLFLVAGKIILKIPWKNLTKESIIVTIEDIYVIAGPVAGLVM